MNHAEFSWRNAGGLRIFAQSWLPDIEPLAIICLVHGQGEHSSRYGHVAAALNQAGYGVLTFDHQGHGQSEGARGDMPSYQALLDDIEHLRREAEARFPQTLQFLYGHSMGGNLVLNYVLRRRPQLAGVVVTSPWLRFSFTPPRFQYGLMQLLNRIWPSFTLNSNLDAGVISRDSAVVAAYQNDAYNHARISARQLVQVGQAGEWALAHAAEFPLPLLLMHGSADRLTSPQASRQFADQVTTDCTFKLWNDLYHETHNEPEQQQVIAFIIGWLQQHIPG